MKAYFGNLVDSFLNKKIDHRRTIEIINQLGSIEVKDSIFNLKLTSEQRKIFGMPKITEALVV